MNKARRISIKYAIFGLLLFNDGISVQAKQMTYDEFLGNANKIYTIAEFIDALESIALFHQSFDKSIPDARSRAEKLTTALAGARMGLPIRSPIFPSALMYDTYSVNAAKTDPQDSFPLCEHLSLSFHSSEIDGMCDQPRSIGVRQVIERLGEPKIISSEAYFVVDGQYKLPESQKKYGFKILKFDKNGINYIIITGVDEEITSIRFSITIK